MLISVSQSKLLKKTSVVENINSRLIDNAKNFLISLRGQILKRETVISNAESCPYATIPRGKTYLPSYGLISSTGAFDLTLGCCYLGSHRLVVLTLRDAHTVDNVKIYLNFASRAYPLGLLPGAVVTFKYLQHCVSKQENVYLSLAAFSSVTVESVAASCRSPSDEPKMNRSPAEKPFISVRPIMDFFDFQRQLKTVATLSYLVCHIIAVQTVTLVWTCSRCGRLPDNCYCHVKGITPTWVLNVKARLLVQDGTGEAMIFIETEELVRRVLFASESKWLEMKNMSRNHKKIWYRRPAYWKKGSSGGDTMADQALSGILFSPKVYRRVKVLCKQFKMPPVEGRQTRQVWLNDIQYDVDISSKITLNLLEIQEINYKEELKTLMSCFNRKA